MHDGSVQNSWNRYPKTGSLDPFFSTTVRFARIFSAVALSDFEIRICGFAAVGHWSRHIQDTTAAVAAAEFVGADADHVLCRDSTVTGGTKVIFQF